MERVKVLNGVYELWIDTPYGVTMVVDYGRRIYASPTYHNKIYNQIKKGESLVPKEVVQCAIALTERLRKPLKKVRSYTRYLREVKRALEREGIIITEFKYDKWYSYWARDDIYKAEVLRRTERF